MRITLVDSNDRSAKRVWERLSRLSGVTLNDRCRSLTHAFNSIEHRPPHLVLYSEEFIALPEFNTMEALCRCLSVKWMVLSQAAHLRKSEVPELNPSAHDDIVLSNLSVCMNSRPIQNATASAGLFKSPQKTSCDGIVLIGSSTGGIDALLNVLGSFPVDCPPTLIVQHTGAGFGSGLARVLNRRVEPSVREVRNGEKPSIGNVLIASGSNTHVQLQGKQTLTCQFKRGERISGHCPSIDALFSSAVPIAKRVTAAILTGMGRDGAEGLLQLRQAGAKTISQDETTSVVYGMPKAAVQIGASQQVLPLSSIGPALLRGAQMRAL